jgi:hypothetical protein
MNYTVICAVARLAPLVLLTGCVSFSLIGCSAVGKDPRDAPWDPPAGRALFEQIPAWDGAAGKVCCGHLRECLPHQSPRC